jgi:pyruvate formate lyase activating enzyme
LELIGREATASEVFEEVLRDKPFYETSGGGMTLSGGEPTQQIDFAAALLESARAAGLHCCVETCGFTDFARLRRLMGLVDLFLYDLKETDPELHRRFTGVPNERILENLRALHAANARIRLRLPLIPGCNARQQHFEQVAQLARELPRLEGIELMFYHPLGESKARRLGLAREPHIQPATPDEDMKTEWIATFAKLGVNVASR